MTVKVVATIADQRSRLRKLATTAARAMGLWRTCAAVMLGS
jgi:hypothetical protein